MTSLSKGRRRRRAFLLVLLLVEINSSSCFVQPSLGQQQNKRSQPSLIFSSSSSSSENKERESLRGKASQLRQEALELEQQLRQQQKQQATSQQEAQNEVRPPPTYSQASDSYWTLTYLFAAQPTPKSNKSDDAAAAPTTRFGGKLTLWLRPDGFTDLIQHEPSSATPLEIVKVWGWDLENSSEDDKDYLLFSLDAQLPNGGDKVRYYWQARQDDTDGNPAAIGFQDGSVTVKQDVVQAGSRWGFFAPQGILAEFRLVGDFVARPAARPSTENSTS